MSRTLRIAIGVIFLLGMVPAAAGPVAAQADQPPDATICAAQGGTFTIDPNGALICYWVPLFWNHDLIVFAHGYALSTLITGLPLSIPWDQLTINGTSLPKTVNLLGYAFAVTSYRKNGLAIKEGVDDIFNLVKVFEAARRLTRKVFVIGASEGGLVTTLALEKDAKDGTRTFSAGMSTCGPVGDFVKQVDYWGDFRLLFDHYFPGAIPTTVGNPAVNIEPAVIQAWFANPSPLQGSIITALKAPQSEAAKLIALSQAAVDPADPTTVGSTTLGILGYNIFSTDEGRFELAGHPVDLSTNAGSPYGNQGRETYAFPGDPPFTVPTYKADTDAIAEILAHYTTTGKIRVPLVGLHTTLDPIVPFWNEILYQAKTQQAGTAFKFTLIPVNRYGHCNFTISEAIFGLIVMIFRGTFGMPQMATIKASMPDAASQDEIQALMDANKALFTYQVFLPSVNQPN